MKASEYAAQYKSDPTPEKLGRVCIDMFLETKTLIEKRKAKTNAAAFATLNEAEQKWRAFVSLVGEEDIRPDGFIRFVKIKMPEIYQGWIDYRRMTAPGPARSERVE